MAKDTGFIHFVCDRDQTHETYAKEGTPQANKFRTIEHVRSDGTRQEFLLCEDCYRAYKTIADAQDSAFTNFMTKI